MSPGPVGVTISKARLGIFVSLLSLLNLWMCGTDWARPGRTRGRSDTGHAQAATGTHHVPDRPWSHSAHMTKRQRGA